MANILMACLLFLHKKDKQVSNTYLIQFDVGRRRKQFAVRGQGRLMCTFDYRGWTVSTSLSFFIWHEWETPSSVMVILMIYGYTEYIISSLMYAHRDETSTKWDNLELPFKVNLFERKRREYLCSWPIYITYTTICAFISKFMVEIY